MYLAALLVGFRSFLFLGTVSVLEYRSIRLYRRIPEKKKFLQSKEVFASLIGSESYKYPLV